MLVIGDIRVTHMERIHGQAMSLDRLFRLIWIYGYVRAIVHVPEHYTTQVCNNCFHQGVRSIMNPVRQRKSRLTRCPQCRVHWHKDVNAALNIRSIWLSQRVTGVRPAAFTRQTQ